MLAYYLIPKVNVMWKCIVSFTLNLFSSFRQSDHMKPKTSGYFLIPESLIEKAYDIFWIIRILDDIGICTVEVNRYFLGEV